MGLLSPFGLFGTIVSPHPLLWRIYFSYKELAFLLVSSWSPGTLLAANRWPRMKHCDRVDPCSKTSYHVSPSRLTRCSSYTGWMSLSTWGGIGLYEQNLLELWTSRAGCLRTKAGVIPYLHWLPRITMRTLATGKYLWTTSEDWKEIY